jgi:putative colanic acid biosynthesis acetyltransferase WcaF
MTTRVRLRHFDAQTGFNRGRDLSTMALWQLVKFVFFRTVFPWPSAMKVVILRAFGAKIGTRVYIKPQVNIHLPWKLAIGDDSWIGEEVFILNFEPVEIGNNVCVSQRVFLCGGNHDFRDPDMAYRNRPIIICDGAWVGAQSFVAPGVTIGAEAVISAGSILLKNAEPALIYGGNPAQPKGQRWK